MFNDLKKKTVIITGGSGFLGSQFVEAFQNKNSNIIILDIVKKNIPTKKLYNTTVTLVMRPL